METMKGPDVGGLTSGDGYFYKPVRLFILHSHDHCWGRVWLANTLHLHVLGQNISSSAKQVSWVAHGMCPEATAS